MRHAFLIIAHNEPYILGTLLEKLSYIPGDTFIHIDRKVKGEAFDKLRTVIGGVNCSKHALTCGGEIFHKSSAS